MSVFVIIVIKGGANVHDDVFVNLDAFDMFVEFPELGLSDKNSLLDSSPDNIGNIEKINLTNNNNTIQNNNNNVIESNHNKNDIYAISDYSPEWAYSEGGIKVLVTGPWESNVQYTVLFDSFPVPTTIVQSGVLRCYCPAHEVGLAALQVACDGFVISNSVIFEYKSTHNFDGTCDGITNESLFKLSLYNRLESIDERLHIKTEPRDTVNFIYIR